MPKGARGTRGKSKGKPNPIRLGIKIIAAPPGTTKDEIREVLKESISDRRHRYKLPPGYQAQVAWSNHGPENMKYDDWTNALIDSSTYGRGWDKLLLNYLDTH